MSVHAAAAPVAAALLFGASTPLAKLLAGEISPLLLAGLLYLGSGLGLGMLLLLRYLGAGRRCEATAAVAISRADLPWLLAAVAAGGMLVPALLMLGLATTDAASASLLLNLEGVFTAVIAWMVFKENADRRIVVGMTAIVLGGAMLSWEPGGASVSAGALLIARACLCGGRRRRAARSGARRRSLDYPLDAARPSPRRRTRPLRAAVRGRSWAWACGCTSANGTSTSTRTKRSSTVIPIVTTSITSTGIPFHGKATSRVPTSIGTRC